MFEGQLQVRLGIVIVALLLTACGGGGNEAGGAPDELPGSPASPSSPILVAPRPVDQSDLEIAAAVYSGTPRTPADFYSEVAPTGYDVVATSHVKNTDIDPSLSVADAQFELCTNDWNEALSWSETNALNAAQYSTLVATNDDPRYFEFARVSSGTPQLYVQSRIYKCAYLDRTAANLRSAGMPAGTLNLRPLSAAELERLSEYLWQFTSYNNFGHAVLKSAATNSSTLQHTVYIASLVRDGTSLQCDRIDVIAWRHSVDTSSGALTLGVQQQFSFGARESGGVAELCAS